MPHGAMEAEALRRIDESVEEMVAFLRGLVRIPTVNPPGENYADCAAYIGGKLREFGYEVRYVEAEGLPVCTPRHPRVNVIGRLAGRRPGPTLHFNGHLDVVPAGEGWTVDPFAGLVRDGRIYGRGVTDQKAGIAASIFAVEALRRGEVPLREFMLKQTRKSDLAMFAKIAKTPPIARAQDTPFSILLPAFVTSELKTAFQIGFLIFLPFLIIDLIIASALMSLGMMMLSPTIISMPFKLLLFVLVDGWALAMGSLAASFAG